MSNSGSISSLMANNINWDLVEHYIRTHVEELPDIPMHVKPFNEGYSNLTYLIKIGMWEAVLRRAPFGEVPAKAHNMEREFKILNRLYPFFSLAPKPYFFCEDPNIMEKHFYVMEKKNGVVLDVSLPPEDRLNREKKGAISHNVVNTLVQLHEVDYEKAGLSDIGRPEGYLKRQVHNWIQRYEHSKTHEIPEVVSIEKWLVKNIPISGKPTIVHNDFKLNNLMLSSTDLNKVVGVFDWEMCTIGDPLTDLGSALAYWSEEGDKDTGLTSVTHVPGFISRREFLERYTKLSNRDVSSIDFYLTFAFYKIGVILQQLYYRWEKGLVKDDRFSKLIDGIFNLMSMAERARNRELL
jgi:aminoglycoside phosphotransferase (APT) family kinase protein